MHAFGPYKRVGKRVTKWYVVVRRPGQIDERIYEDTKQLAEATIRRIEKENDDRGNITVGDAIGLYEKFRLMLVDRKQLKRRSEETKLGNVWRFLLPMKDRPLKALTPSDIKSLYTRLAGSAVQGIEPLKKKNGEVFSMVTVNATAFAAKDFFAWSVKEGLIKSNPSLDLQIEPARGEEREQIGTDEAIRFIKKAFEVAGGADYFLERRVAREKVSPLEGGVAAATALLLGARASEIATRQVRHLDDNGWRLVVTRGKTKKATRRLKVPAILRSFLLLLAAGKGPEDYLFGPHATRHRILSWVQRIGILAKVSIDVTTHSLRRTNSTLRVERDEPEEEIMRQMGHEKFSTTLGSYISPDAYESSQQRRVERQLKLENRISPTTQTAS